MVMFLIRYNELGLKSPRVRSRFQKQLIKNIEDKFLRVDLDCFIDSDWGRIYLHTDDQELGIGLLSSVFGITSVSPVINSSDALDEITETVVHYSRDLLKPGKTFALRTRRTGEHPYTSIGLAEHVGAAILNAYSDKKLKVNLSNPEVEIFIEVRRNESFIFSESFKGPGGLPLSTQGKVLSIITDDRSYIAAWLMMKRGCRVYPVYFKSNDIKVEAGGAEPEAQIQLLKGWVQNIRLKVIDVEKKSKDNFGLVDLNNKEFLNYVQYVNAKGICLSCSIEIFSSRVQAWKSQLPLFYPLIGLDEEQVHGLEHIIKVIV